MGSKAKITTVSIVRENEVIPMNKAIPPCKNTAAKIAVDFHLSDAKVAASMYTHLYALTCGVVGCAERAAGVPFSVPGVGAAA